MFGGKLAAFDEIELYLDMSVTGSATCSPTFPDYNAGYGGSCWYETKYQGKFNQPILQGIYHDLTFGDTVGAAATNTATLEVPALSISESRSGVSSSSKVILEDVELFLQNAASAGGAYWLIRGSNLKWYVGGVLEYTHGSWTLDTNSGATYNPYLTPTCIPLLGIPAVVSAAPTVSGPGTVFVATAYPSGTSESTITTNARFRWKVGATWYTEPVFLSIMTAPSLSCSFPIGTDPTVTCTNTGNLAIEAYAENVTTAGATFSNTTGNSTSVTVCMMPDHASSVNRIDSDNYRALWYRFGLPQAKETGTRNCTQFSPVAGATTATSSNVVVAQADEYLGVVTGAPAIIEDQLAETVYAPYIIIRSGELIQNDPAAPANGTQDITLKFPTDVTFPSPYVTHHKHTESSPVSQWNQDVCNYFAYRAHPLWSYYLFPADEASAPWATYYKKIRSQWLGYSTIAADERIGSRNHILLEPILEHGMAPYIDLTTSLGQTSWVGVCRWKQDNPTVPASYQTDSGSTNLWTPDLDGDGATGDDCTLTFGAGGVTATPIGGATTLHFQMDLGSYDYEPWMYPHICREIEVGWSVTNMTNCLVELVGVDDEVIELTDNVTGKYPWPLTGTADKYADTGIIPYGLGVITDTGTDLIGADTISSATFGTDAERFFAPQLLPGKTAKWLRYTCTVTGAVTVDWPKFYAPANSDTYRPVPVAPTGQLQVMVTPDGPGTTFGHLSNWDYDLDTFSHDWIVRDAGQKMSTLDWLCYRRFVWEAKDCEDGLDTEIASLYVNPEEYTLRAHLARDPLVSTQYTTATMMPVDSEIVGAAMVNSLAEVPPLTMFPHWNRNANYIQGTTFSKDVWSWVQGPSRTVCDSELHTWKLPGDQWSTNEVPGISAWSVTRHEKAVEYANSVDDYRGRTSTGTVKDWFKALPWRGWFAILGVGNPAGSECVSYDVGADQYHARAYTSASGLYTGLASNPLNSWADTLQAIDPEWCCIRVDRGRTRKFYLVVEDGGSVILYTSTDGVTFS